MHYHSATLYVLKQISTSSFSFCYNLNCFDFFFLYKMAIFGQTELYRSCGSIYNGLLGNLIYPRRRGGGGALCINHAQMCVLKSEENGYFFGFK